MTTRPFDLVMDRIQEDLELTSESGVAAVLGMKPSAYFNRKKAGSIPYEQVLRLCRERQLDIEWILGGIADYLAGDVPESEEGETRIGKQIAARTRSRKPRAEPAGSLQGFELVERRALLGGASGDSDNVVTSRDQALAMRLDWFRRRGVVADQLIVADVVGDSMEETLFDGDTVLFDADQTVIAADDIYLFELEGKLHIKRLRAKPRRVIEVISDNREHYPPLELTLEQLAASGFEVRGRFIWRGGDRLQ